MLSFLLVLGTALLGLVAGGVGLAAVGAILGLFFAGATGPLVFPARFGSAGVGGAINMVIIMDVGALLGLFFRTGVSLASNYGLFIGPVALALITLNVLAIVRHVQRKSGRSW